MSSRQMDTTTPFSSRRPAAASLPTFSLPLPNSDVPSMAFLANYNPRPSSPYGLFSSGSLTSSPGASEILSPSLSSVNTTSSQGSSSTLPSGYQQYTCTPNVNGSSLPSSSSLIYNMESIHATSHPFHNSPYGGRPAMYNSHANMGYGQQRSSQSPATGGEALPAPPYESMNQPFNTPVPSGSASGAGEGSGSGAGSGSSQESHHHLSPSQGNTHVNAMLSHHNSTHPPAPSTTLQSDSYLQSRGAANHGYYVASTGPAQSGFSTYASHGASSQHSPTSAGPVPRAMGPMAGPLPPHSAMAPPPQSCRSYSSYQHMAPTMNGPTMNGPTMNGPTMNGPTMNGPTMNGPTMNGPTMNGPVLSNMHQPGGQMSVIPGMNLPAGYNTHPIMYTHHSQPPPQSERPFKCDQCTQSFSRNHDLKRHKRIHLAVKPFPCSYCSKSFSRKDALKRHRLVKGCESKAAENLALNENGTNRSLDMDEEGSSLSKE